MRLLPRTCCPLSPIVRCGWMAGEVHYLHCHHIQTSMRSRKRQNNTIHSSSTISSHSISAMAGSRAASANSNSGMASDEEAAALVPQSTTLSANIEIPASAVASVHQNSSASLLRVAVMTFWDEVWASTELLFQSKLTWLLLVGPVAVYGDSTGYIGESTCFICAGLALIPCAERYVTRLVNRR